VLVGGLDIHMGRGNFQGEKGLAQDMSGSQYTQSKLSRGSIGMVWIPIRVTRWSAHWHHLANIIIIIIIIRTFVTSAVSANILNLRRKTTQHCKASACNGDTSAPATFVRNRLKSSTSTNCPCVVAMRPYVKYFDHMLTLTSNLHHYGRPA